MDEHRDVERYTRGGTVHRAVPYPRRFLAWTLSGALVAVSGCGLESAGTAATAGATKQMELEQARKTQEQVRQQVQQSMEQMNKRNEQLDGATQ